MTYTAPALRHGAYCKKFPLFQMAYAESVSHAFILTWIHQPTYPLVLADSFISGA